MSAYDELFSMLGADSSGGPAYRPFSLNNANPSLSLGGVSNSQQGLRLTPEIRAKILGQPNPNFKQPSGGHPFGDQYPASYQPR